MEAPDPSFLQARLQRLQAYLAEDPRNGELLAATFDAAMEAGEFECARSCIESARSLNLPSSPWQHREVLWLRGLHRCGLLSEALEWTGQRMKEGTLAPVAAGVASLAAIDSGDFTLAAKLAERSMQADTVTLEVLVAQASVALARRESGEAARLLERASDAAPGDGRTQCLMGMLHLQVRELAAAQACFTQALVAMPAHVGTWHGLGWACLLQGDRSNAANAFDRALALDRNFAESHGAVGLVLLLAGRTAEANHHLDAADRLDRANVTGRYARALAAGHLADARALQALAARLLDRPGLFGGKLRDEVAQRAH